jgi:hypothetical protein
MKTIHMLSSVYGGCGEMMEEVAPAAVFDAGIELAEVGLEEVLPGVQIRKPILGDVNANLEVLAE